MRLPFGITLTRQKAKAPSGSMAVHGGGGWTRLWGHDFRDQLGSWQQDLEIKHDAVLAQATVFTCITLIASDIAKLNLRIVQRYGRVWLEKSTPGLTDLLETPNHFQTRQQFIESWLISKLSRGNTYVLKDRASRRERPRALHVLDPDRVTPLVAPNGDVYYQLGEDDLAGVVDPTHVVPASEIIHDRWNCLFHPLVGLSPIFASGLAATQALQIQQNSAKFFKNQSRPSGILTAPSQIGEAAAERIKKYWEDNYQGANKIGSVAVLGDGLTYTPMIVNAVDAQLIEQLKITAEQVCATFHVPPYMAAAAAPPALNNIEAEQQRYYSQCLQSLIEGAEACLDAGLELKAPVDGNVIRTNFDLRDLLRMDKAAKVKTLAEAVGGGIMMPDEAREDLDLLPTEGGNAVYLQQQNYSLAALAKRDAQPDPFGKTPAPAPAPAALPAPQDVADAGKAFGAAARQELEETGRAVIAELREQAADTLKAAAAEVAREIGAAVDGATGRLADSESGAAEAIRGAAVVAGQAIAEAASQAASVAGAAVAGAEQRLAEVIREASKPAPAVSSPDDEHELAELEELAASIALALETVDA